LRRHRRVRSKVAGTAERPRLAVFKSNRYIYAQLINDETHASLLAMSTKGLKTKSTSSKEAHALGKRVATEAKKQGVTTVVFDRGGFSYAGNVKNVAEGAREGGLIF